MPTYLTRREAAERAEVDTRTIDRWLRTPGKLTPYRTVGREPVRILQEELDALLEPAPAQDVEEPGDGEQIAPIHIPQQATGPRHTTPPAIRLRRR